MLLGWGSNSRSLDLQTHAQPIARVSKAIIGVFKGVDFFFFLMSDEPLLYFLFRRDNELKGAGNLTYALKITRS